MKLAESDGFIIFELLFVYERICFVKNIILELGMYCFSPSYYNYVLVIKMTTANKDIKWWIVACSFSLNLENKRLSIPCMSARSKSMVN